MSVHNEGGDRKCLYDESVLPSLFEDCEWDKPYLTRLRAIAVALQHTNEDKVRKNIQTAVKLLGASDTVVTRGFVNVCNFARVRAVIKEAANDRHQSLVDEHVIYSCNVFNFTSPFFALPLRTLFKNQTTTGVVLEDCSLAKYQSIPLHPEIRDNRLHTFFRNYPDTYMTDGIIVMMVAALQYMRQECLSHGDLHAGNAFLTPLTSLYGFEDTSYMLFDTYQKKTVDDVTLSTVELTGLVKIFDWDRAQILDANDPYLLADTLGFLRMLRFFRIKLYTDTIQKVFLNKNDERKRYESFLSASARSRTFSGPIRKFVSVCRERRFELTKIGFKNATFHIEPTRVYEQKPNKYVPIHPINESDFGYEINDGKVKIWEGDKLSKTLSDKDDFIFTWTLIQYQQTLPKTLRMKDSGPIRKFVSVCQERHFKLTKIGFENAEFHVKPTRVYEQEPNKYVAINESDFGYEINNGKVKIWKGDKLFKTLSDKDDYIFTWTFDEVLLIRGDIFIPIKQINAIVENIYVRALSAQRGRKSLFPLRFS